MKKLRFKTLSHEPILRIRFLVPKIRSRRSDGPISRFSFCGENVERSFAVCSHDLIFRTNKESSIWRQNDHRDIMQNLSAPFIFQEECRMKIEDVLFPYVFSNLQIHVSESHFHCVHTIQFSEPTKIGSLKTNRVNGPSELQNQLAPTGKQELCSYNRVDGVGQSKSLPKVSKETSALRVICLASHNLIA